MESGGKKEQAPNSSKLLDASSEFVFTYEDKEGDWMLVGDDPWGHVTMINLLLFLFDNLVVEIGKFEL